MAIATSLEDATTSADSGSGAGSVFASTLVSQAGVVAGTLGINVAEAMGMFSNVPCAVVQGTGSGRLDLLQRTSCNVTTANRVPLVDTLVSTATVATKVSYSSVPAVVSAVVLGSSSRALGSH